jgi:hypothetical protein
MDQLYIAVAMSDCARLNVQDRGRRNSTQIHPSSHIKYLLVKFNAYIFCVCVKLKKHSVTAKREVGNGPVAGRDPGVPAESRGEDKFLCRFHVSDASTFSRAI